METTRRRPSPLVFAGQLEAGELCDPGVPARVIFPAGARTPEDFLRVETLEGFLALVHRDELVVRLREVA